MVQQLSTSISDGVLALVAMRATLGLISVNFFAAIGFGILAGAASFGVIRFAQSNPNWTIVNWHNYLSWMTAAVGIPFIACGYFRHANASNIANLFLATGVAMILLRKYTSEKLVTDGANVLAGLGMVAMMLDGVYSLRLYITVGAAFFIAAETVVGTNGFMSNGMRRVDVFHYLLAASVVAFTIGFHRMNTSEIPIFYNYGQNIV